MTNRTLLTDELALRNLDALYCDAVNRRDAKSWRKVWAEQASWLFLGNEITGADTITDTWEKTMAGFPVIFHHHHSGLIKLNGNTAQCRWYIDEQIIDLEQNPLRFMGVYNDECVFENGQWLFSKRHFELIYQGEGALTNAGWQGYPQAFDHPL